MGLGTETYTALLHLGKAGLDAVLGFLGRVGVVEGALCNKISATRVCGVAGVGLTKATSNLYAHRTISKN